VVYERIAQFMLGRSSILPLLGTERQAKETRHAYVARVYDKLLQESVAMQRYFDFMQNGKRLHACVHTRDGAQRVRLPTTFFSLLTKYALPSAQIPNASSTPITNAVID
jgi:hypothetical protein